MNGGFSNWIGFGILGVWLPVLVALHFFHSSPRRQTVSSHYLWRLALQKQTRRSIWQRFENSLFFLLQLFASLALGVGLCEPFITRPGASLPAVLVFDVSASMQSLVDGRTRLQTGKDQLATALRRADVEQAYAVCLADGYQQQSKKLNLSRALRYCQPTFLPSPDLHSVMASTAKTSSGRKIFVTDEYTEVLNAALMGQDVELLVTGGESQNLWIEDVFAQRKDSTVQAEGLFQATEAVEATLQFENRLGEVLAQREVSFRGGRQRVSVNLQGPLKILKVKVLSAKNVLKADDAMWIPVANEEVLVDLSGLDPDSRLRAMIRRWMDLIGGLTEGPGGVAVTNTADEADVWIVPTASSTNLSIEDLLGFVLRPDHPLSRYVKGTGLYPAKLGFKGLAEFDVLALSAKRDGGQSTPLMGCRGDSLPCYLNLADTDHLGASMEAVIVIRNLIELIRQKGGVTPVMDLQSDMSEATLVQSLDFPGSGPLPGMYKDSDRRTWIARISPQESRLSSSPAQWLKPGLSRRTTASPTRMELSAWLFALAFLLLFLESFLYLRRRS